jgi:hypothetical protein
MPRAPAFAPLELFGWTQFPDGQAGSRIASTRPGQSLNGMMALPWLPLLLSFDLSPWP